MLTTRQTFSRYPIYPNLLVALQISWILFLVLNMNEIFGTDINQKYITIILIYNIKSISGLTTPLQFVKELSNGTIKYLQQSSILLVIYTIVVVSCSNKIRVNALHIKQYEYCANLCVHKNRVNLMKNKLHLYV